MELRVLRYFLIVAKEQSFTKAAEQLHITQPTLSRQLAAMEILAQIIARFKEKYPLVQIALHTGTADTTLDMMNKGLIDIGLFLEPTNTENLDYIRIQDSDRWVVSMKPDDPLTQKEVVTKEDLLQLPLILPERYSVQSELANWFGRDFEKVQIAFTSNLGTNAGVMAMNGLGYPISIEGAAKYWRRNISYSRTIQLFIEEINAFRA